MPFYTIVRPNLLAISDAVLITIIAFSIIAVLLIVAIVVWFRVKSRRKKLEKHFELTDKVEQDLGKLTLEFANAVFKASNGNLSQNATLGSGSSFGGGTAFAPITLIMNAPAHNPGVPVQGAEHPMYHYGNALSYGSPMSGAYGSPYNMPALNTAADNSKSTDALTPYQPKKSITEYDFAKKLSRKAYYNALLTYMTDDMIIERVFEEVYRPKKYSRKRLFKNKSLVREQIRRAKRRMYNLYKGGLSVADSCKGKYDLEREAELFKTCTMEYLCGFTVDTVEKADDIETLKERRNLLLQIQRAAADEIRLNVERAAAIRRDERQNFIALDEKKELAKISGRSGKASLYTEIDKLRSLIYENDKVADEAERVIYFKNELLGNVNKSLKILETVILYMENLPVNLPADESPAAKVNEKMNEYDVFASEIEELERERAIVESHLRSVIEKIGAGGLTNDRLTVRCDELSEKLSLLDSRLESLRKKSINKIIMEGNVYSPSVYSPNVTNISKSKKYNETVILRRQLRFTENENEAVEILSRLYALKSGLSGDELLDKELVVLVDKSIKEGLQAVELNKYDRIVKDCKAAIENKKREQRI